MTIIYCIAGGAAVAFLVFLLLLAGRKGHPGLQRLKGFAYAHRGLHGKGVPENSMAAFRAALEAGYGVELDVHLMKDGDLAVIHDASLQRTAGVDVRIEELTARELPQYPLEGTEEIIPLLSQVLELYAGKAPLIIELKPEGGNHAALCQAVCDMLRSYEGAYCLESFDPRCIYWLRKNRPEFVRGQLSENFFHSKKSRLPGVLKFAMTHLLSNFLTRPDFVAYRFKDRRMLSVTLCRKVLGLQGVTWTLISKEEYDLAVKEGYLPIFENFLP